MRHLLVLAGMVVVAACNTAELKTAPTPTPTTDPVEGEEQGDGADDGDEAPSKDGGAVVKHEPLDAGPTDSGANLSCPVPPKITPADVPAGFLKPVKVTVAHLADGDSGDFNFPGNVKHGVRMLWVNTEESGGAEMTDFGVKTKYKVFDMYKNVADIQIAVQETSTGSGMPKVDNPEYNRWLSLIFLNGELLQTRLIREGLTAYYTQFGCAFPSTLHKSLLYAEAEANDNDRGIWGPGPHNDYEKVFQQWIGTRTCRPNPYKAPYCN